MFRSAGGRNLFWRLNQRRPGGCRCITYENRRTWSRPWPRPSDQCPCRWPGRWPSRATNRRPRCRSGRTRTSWGSGTGSSDKRRTGPASGRVGRLQAWEIREGSGCCALWCAARSPNPQTGTWRIDCGPNSFIFQREICIKFQINYLHRSEVERLIQISAPPLICPRHRNEDKQMQKQ